MTDTVFHKILRGEIPSKKEYEDEDCIVIHSIAPQAPVHLLVIPKKEFENIGKVAPEDAELVGRLMLVAVTMAKQFGIEDSFRVVMNNGALAGQSVMYMHIHVLGGWKTAHHTDL